MEDRCNQHREHHGTDGTCRRARVRWALFAALLAAVSSSACVTVRPEQRAILSDPKMRFQGEPRTAAELDHVLENREGSFGGGSVEGGGCGCN